MGVCKLDYINIMGNKTLIVYLRKPGLLIGKHGNTIDKLEEYLGIKIKIVEVSLLK